jgi:hypothetical protein
MSGSGKGKSTSPVRTKRLGVGELAGSRLLPHMVPWSISAAAMPAALVTHIAVQGDGSMVALMGAGSVGLTLYVRATWARRHELTRALATVFTGAVTGWFTLASATDPLNPEMVKVWAFGTVVLSLAWNLRHGAMSAHHDTDKAEGHKDPLFQRVSALAGARTKKVKESGNRVEAKVQLKPGDSTVEDVTAARAHIASAVGMDPNEVTVTGVRGRGDQVTLAFEPEEDANAVMLWNGPSRPGQSVAAGPLVYGGRRDGSDMAIWMGGDDESGRPSGHTLVTGVPNSGKTEGVKTIIIDGRSRIDFCAVVGDPDKFEQSFGEIADTLSIAAKGPAQVMRLIKNLPDAIRYRAERLGTLPRSDGTVGYGQWEPECWTLHGIPFVMIDIEEAATVLSSSDDDFDTAVRTARSVGFAIFASMQTAHNQNIDRRTRGLFANALAFGCREDYDAKFTLSATTREAGADPTKWGADFPGKHYAESIGTDRTLWAVEGRALRLTRTQKRAELDASRPFWAVLDPGTAMCLGAGIQVPDSKLTAGLPPVPLDVPAPDEDPVNWYGETDNDREQALDLTAVPDEDGALIDVTEPIPDPGFAGSFSLRPEPAGGRMSTADARAALEAKIDELEAGGAAEITFEALSELPGITGRTRQWVYAELKRLTEAGRLETSNGKPPYVVRPRIRNGHRAN